MCRALRYGISKFAISWPPKMIRVRVTRESVEQAFLLSWVRLLMTSSYSAEEMAKRIGITMKSFYKKLEQPTIRDMGLLCYAAGVEPQLTMKAWEI